MLPDPQVWARFGIQKLRDVIPAGILLSFKELSAKFRLPCWMYFRYFQLQHAVCSQFLDPPILETDPIEDLLEQESMIKPLSTLYLALLSTASPKMDRFWKQRHTYITCTLDREAWEGGFEDNSKLMIASKNKLIQAKFLHGVYFTTQNLSTKVPYLFKMPYGRRYLFPYVLDMSSGGTVLDRFLILAILVYSCLSPVPLNWHCWASMTMSKDPDKPSCSYDMCCTTQRRKYSLSGLPPLLPQYPLVNWVLPMYKLTYINRNCPGSMKKSVSHG